LATDMLANQSKAL